MKFKSLLTFIISIILVLLALALGAENKQLINVNLLFVNLEIGLATLLFVTFVLGILTNQIFRLFKKVTR